MSKFDINSLIGTPDALKNTVRDIPIESLVPYSKHCFKLYSGERLDDMVQSIAKNGVITPIIARTMADGKYEILAGHNRVYAAGQAGLKAVPSVIKENLSDEDAEIYVVETNLMQRGFKDLKISEQAFAVALRYKNLFDSDKVQAIEDEIIAISTGQKVRYPVDNEKSGDGYERKITVTADEYGISQASVARLVRINSLIDELKKYIDRGDIKIRPAVDLSFLSEKLQRMLVRTMEENKVNVIDTKTAKQLREVAESYAEPSEEVITEVICGTYDDDEKPKEKGEKITIPKATYTRYLGGYSKKEANLIIEKALAYYFENNEEETA